VFLCQPHASDDLRDYWLFCAVCGVKGKQWDKNIFWVLAIWLFVIAAFIPIAGAYVTLAGLCPMEDILRTLHSARPS
jgi:hypothetical protein